jgi:type IV secretion system protein VirB5
MKKHIARFIVAISILLSCQGAHAGVPTVNIPQIIQDLMAWTTTYAAEIEQVINGIQQIEQYYQMYEQAVKEYEAYKKYYDEVSGYKGFGDFINGSVFEDVIPNEFVDLYNNAAEGNAKGVYKTIKGIAKKHRESTKIWDCENLSESQSAICKHSLEKNSKDLDQIDQINKSIRDKIVEVDKLAQQIEDTANSKDIAELSASIQAAQAKLQIASTRAYVAIERIKKSDQQQQQQEREKSIKAINKASAITWNFPNFKINKE